MEGAKFLARGTNWRSCGAYLPALGTNGRSNTRLSHCQWFLPSAPPRLPASTSQLSARLCGVFAGSDRRIRQAKPSKDAVRLNTRNYRCRGIYHSILAASSHMAPHKVSPQSFLVHSLPFSCQPLNWGDWDGMRSLQGEVSVGRRAFSQLESRSRGIPQSSLPDPVMHIGMFSGVVELPLLSPAKKLLDFMGSTKKNGPKPAICECRLCWPATWKHGNIKEPSPRSTNGKQTILTPG